MLGLVGGALSQFVSVACSHLVDRTLGLVETIKREDFEQHLAFARVEVVTGRIVVLEVAFTGGEIERLYQLLDNLPDHSTIGGGKRGGSLEGPR
jgi:hypothetical protein